MMDAGAFGIQDLIYHNPIVGPPRRGARRAWTNKEMAVLRATYPTAGVPGCLPLLPGRSAAAIQRQAVTREIPGPRIAPREKRVWTSSPQMDAVIRRVYQGTPARGDIKKLAVTLGRPHKWVSRRAAKLGLTAPRFREPDWSATEIEFVGANAHKDPVALRRLLKRQGFNRTASAITVKLKRLGQPTGRNADLNHYNASQLATLFGVHHTVVASWIAKGWLHARHRGTARTASQNGDEHRIHRRDVRRFVIENTAAIDIRKVEKFWFVEMLTTAEKQR